MDNWHRIKDKEPEVCVEVTVYNQHDKDQDYNPTGVSTGFMMDDKSFCVAVWNNEYDFWECVNISPLSPRYPTHWQPKPQPPKD